MKSYVIWALWSLLKLYDEKKINSDELVKFIRSLYTTIDEGEE